MAFLQKTWKDRVAEYINRRVLTKEDGTTELVSVERSEGTISQEGDAFSAANMNDLEQRIANEFSEQNKKIDYVPVAPKGSNMFTIGTNLSNGFSYLAEEDGYIILDGAVNNSTSYLNLNICINANTTILRDIRRATDATYGLSISLPIRAGQYAIFNGVNHKGVQMTFVSMR